MHVSLLMRYLVFLLLSLGLVFSGCVRNNPKPVWITINTWTLTDNPDPSASDPGDLTHNFSDAWVYVDDKLIGTFELPCKIPVLASGTKQVKIYPTVRNNGISATKKIYPFCKEHTVMLDLVEGGSYTIDPVTYYNKDCVFWIEEFAGNASVDIVDDNNSTAHIEEDNDPAIMLTGNYGHVHLSDDSSQWLATLSQSLSLPKGGAEVYLEIDYRSDTTRTTTGLFAGSTENDHVTLLPNGMRWRRVYIDFKEIVSYSVTASSFLPYFKAGLPTGVSSADIYIDNIRIVHF